MNIPTIETARLRLRGFSPLDRQPLQAILGDRDVIRYLPTTEPWPKQKVRGALDRHWAHWTKRGFGWWAVETIAARELLGWCGLGYLDDTAEVEIKYLLKKSHWGKGIATEAATPCIEHAFKTLALDRIIGLVHPDNRPSARVLEKLGLVLANEAHYFGIDVVRYTIDREGYEEFLRRTPPREH